MTTCFAPQQHPMRRAGGCGGAEGREEGADDLLKDEKEDRNMV